MLPNNFTTPTPYILPPLQNPLQVPAPGPLPSMVSQATLNLNQIQNFEPVSEFIDENNTKWSLVKAASNSTIDIPDPKNLQIVDFWNHAFPGVKSEIFIYVVEGIRPARVETEQPSRILYQWFSSRMVPNFTPQMITDREWMKANVYAAPVTNARISKLNALCHIKNGGVAAQSVQEDQLIHVEGLSNAKPAERPTE